MLGFLYFLLPICVFECRFLVCFLPYQWYCCCCYNIEFKLGVSSLRGGKKESGFCW